MTSPLPNAAAVNDSQPNPPFVLFPPLPDPVGYAGNFAATLGGRLITGGGSQFSDKPMWLHGTKTFTDRIFALSCQTGAWTQFGTRLPRQSGHFAFAASDAAVYVAGGTTTEGLLDTVWEIRLAGDEVKITSLPALPRPVIYAAGALAHGRFYVIGGQHDASVKAATREVWSLDVTTQDAWHREPDLPGTGTFVAATASDGRAVYLIGGVGFDASGIGVQSRKLHRLSPGATEWEALPDLPEPRVGPVTPCPIIGDRIFVMGGYASAFGGEKRDHPGFSRQTYLFDIARQTWSKGPVLPHEKPTDKDSPTDQGPAPMVAAPGAVWKDHFVAVGGEVRASVRTPAVVAYTLSSL